MLLHHIESLETDVLVIGGGGAGLRAAIGASEKGATTILATKGLSGRSGATAMAKSGYQAVLNFAGNPDSFESAFEDTRVEGRYLGDENLIQVLTTEAGDRARDLQQYGIKFNTTDDGNLMLIQYPGFSHPRTLVVKGNGYAMAACLMREVLQHESIRVFEDCLITRLFTTQGKISGALALDMRRGIPVLIKTPSVILATGGYHELWRWTDAEPGLTGDGIYLAFQAGADLVDLEMMQYYPTALCHPAEVAGTVIGYEALLNAKYCAGAMLNGLGEPFLPDPTNLPVRDITTRLIFREIDEGRGAPHGGVYITMENSPHSKEKIWQILLNEDASVYKHLKELGTDVLNMRIEVKPFTHYFMGGVRINEWTKTTVPGLFAAGEVSGNLQGANRTGGNALAETQVFGARAGWCAAEHAVGKPVSINENDVNDELYRLEDFFRHKDNNLSPIGFKREVKALMDSHVGHQRHEEGLISAIEAFNELLTNDLPRLQVRGGPREFNYDWQEAIEAANMAVIARLIAASALAREESRGHHWRTDFPETLQEWEKHTVIRNSCENNYIVTDSPIIRHNTNKRKA